VCNLLCGAGHSLMRSTVHVVTQARFREWIAAQERALAPAGRNYEHSAAVPGATG